MPGRYNSRYFLGQRVVAPPGGGGRPGNPGNGNGKGNGNGNNNNGGNGGGPTGDPQFSNVRMLLHLDGANGSTSFPDSSSYANTWSPTGAAQISTATSKFGGASLNPNGSPVTCTQEAEFALGTSDFCIEGWIYPTALTGAFRGIFARRNQYTSQDFGAYLASGTGSLNFEASSAGGSPFFTAVGAVPTINAWSHFAITREGANLRIFLNGALGSTTNIGATGISSTQGLFLGKLGNDGAVFSGFIDEFRWTIGAARYTAAFTPPSAAFPNS